MGDSLEILSEVLDKLIDTQIQNAQVTSELKGAVEDNNQELRELQILLSKINAHFSNGFRHELKTAISEAAQEIKQQMDTKATEGHIEASRLYNALTEFTTALKSPKAWITAFVFVGSIFGTIAAIVAVVLKIMGGP